MLGNDIEPRKVMPERPSRLLGHTEKATLHTPSGESHSFYITVNSWEGLPFEIFISSGKSGDDANADSEALGRVVSIALQYGVPAEVVIKTLHRINGPMLGTLHGERVTSKGDLIAVALKGALQANNR